MIAISKQINAFSVKLAAVWWFSALTGITLNVSGVLSTSETSLLKMGSFDILTLLYQWVLTATLEHSPVTLTHYLSDVTFTKESCNVLVNSFWSEIKLSLYNNRISSNLVWKKFLYKYFPLKVSL